MARETVAERKVRASKVLERLDQAMPDAHIELDYRTPLQLVTAVVHPVVGIIVASERLKSSESPA